MKIKGKTVSVFKIRNRRGYAAICCSNLTEGGTAQEACCRMEKALKRKPKKR
jgi:hypothetical protein